VRFIDANVFIRYLTQDDPAKAMASGALIEALARSEDEAMTSEAVIAEIFYVLTSRAHYGLDRADAAERVRPIVLAQGLRLPNKGTVVRGLDVYSTYRALDIEDALSVAHIESAGVSEILSFDRGFDHVEGIVRVEP
jgi:uncharacterized protein